jgi:hypothetical protein
LGSKGGEKPADSLFFFLDVDATFCICHFLHESSPDSGESLEHYSDE